MENVQNKSLGKNPELYTGHSFRRSSATLLANAGEGIIGVKQIEGWKSTSVAEQYIEDSVSNKIRLAEKVFTGRKKMCLLVAQCPIVYQTVSISP
jgi:integrase